MINFDIKGLDWLKMANLIPAIIQDADTGKVLMLGYMNRESLEKTKETKLLTLYSRSKKKLWQKGETSGNYMLVETIDTDCDKDSLLILVRPEGPACHLGFKSCFAKENHFSAAILTTLVEIIKERQRLQTEGSYSVQLLKEGLSRTAQKVGEEAVETVIAAMKEDKDELIEEASDLLFHLLILLQILEVSLNDIFACLAKRHQAVKPNQGIINLEDNHDSI